MLHLAFIGPGGPEFLVVMLVLLMMFGAKDAPRILRKLNEIINQIRNTADGFKREVMYGDLNKEKPSCDESDHGEDDYYGHGGDDGDDGKEYQLFEEGQEDGPVEDVPEPEAEDEVPVDEDGDAQKT